MQGVTIWNEEQNHEGKFELKKQTMHTHGVVINLELIKYTSGGDVSTISVRVRNAKCTASKPFDYANTINLSFCIGDDVKNSIGDLCMRLSEETGEKIDLPCKLWQDKYYLCAKVDRNTKTTRGSEPLILVYNEDMLQVKEFRADVVITFPRFWIKNDKRKITCRAHEVYILPIAPIHSLMRPNQEIPVDDPFQQVLDRRLRAQRKANAKRRVPTRKAKVKEIPLHFIGMIKDEDRNCPICIEQVENDAYLTPCFHLFHKKCIDKWKRRSTKCPKCKQQIRH